MNAENGLLAGLLHATHLGVAYRDGLHPAHPACAYCTDVAALMAADGWTRPIPPGPVLCTCTRWDYAKDPNSPDEHVWEPGEGKCPDTPPPYVFPPADHASPEFWRATEQYVNPPGATQDGKP